MYTTGYPICGTRGQRSKYDTWYALVCVHMYHTQLANISFFKRHPGSQLYEYVLCQLYGMNMLFFCFYVQVCMIRNVYLHVFVNDFVLVLQACPPAAAKGHAERVADSSCCFNDFVRLLQACQPAAPFAPLKERNERVGRGHT